MTIEQLQEQLKEAQEQNRLHNYAKAEEMAQEVLEWCDELQEQEEEKDIDNLRVVGNLLIGETLWRRGNYKKALFFAEASWSYSKKLNSIKYIIQCKLLFANTHLRISDYQSALQYLEESESIAIEHKRERDLVIIKNILGEVHREWGYIEDAIKLFYEVIDLAQTQKMDNYIATAVGNLGGCYIILGKYDKAIELCMRSVEYCKISNNIAGQATSLSNIGGIYLAQGSYLLSLDNLQEALQLIQKVEATSLKGSIYTNMASCYRGMGDFQESLRYYLKALEIQEACGANEKVAHTLGNIAILYRFLENYDLAKSYFLQTFDLYEKIKGPHSYLEYLGNYAHMLYQQGEYVKAQSYLEEITTIFYENGYDIQACQYSGYLCSIHIHNNEFDKAKEIAFRRYQVFCEHNRNDETPNALELIGDLYANPAFAEYNVELAEQYYLQSMEKFVEINSKDGIYHSHQHIAQFYKQNNRWEEYAANIEKSMELYKEVQNDEVKKQADRFGWERKIAEMEKEKEIEKVRTEAEKKLLEQQIASQKREVETTIHELVNKNSLLHEVRKDVQVLSKHTIREGQDVVERLLDRLERNIVPLESKSDLEKQWAEVHAPFMELMKQRYPTLTTMELKICALLKMKLTSSNICSILFLSKRTIEFHRLNIRKKMELSKSDDIYVLLNSLM